MKIENDDLWERIKSGELKGLSIEGYFVDKLQKMSTPIYSDENLLKAMADILEIKSNTNK